ncbi:acyl-CoA dehydrogenase family protein [Enterovirga sp.]|uniref:acyl-CoA dehydrogenase family protein n=1 Tax=Enterovirga sp. TaxID=2026350 RepID=UPI00260E92D7|nr:acyl-CoA dehydrogenase family protein [Enterovirga sp.]MDB5590610.1 hypothetical protein [Enterovirga sp.]
MIEDLADRLFAEIAISGAPGWPPGGAGASESWGRLAELGLPLALVPEEAGGPGLDLVEALELVRAAGRHALALPLAETMLANHILAEAGLPVAPGAATILCGGPQDQVSLRRAGSGWTLAGRAFRVPWASVAETLVVVAPGEAGPCVARLEAGAFTVEPGRNLAGEPRDAVLFDTELRAEQVRPAGRAGGPDVVRRRGAALRSLALAGALERVLALTVAYAGERSQFGKPIGRFQAVQQSLAEMAGHVAAGAAAAGGAAEAFAGADLLPIAAAKVRTGEAAGRAAAIAHQVHGAIGFTQEHILHRFTGRLWSWRDEFGDEAEWSLALGTQAVEAGPDGLWPLVTAA